ncbi:hypothetical protein AA15669_1877 [Saccharibacter floricola DSM 15669]|uniref:Uncharacterized protein n=1 Tax=Saccharibacter floricola DSM 15669 TaxID=1123227 RepID=A0ABQ0P113_9PROT|nr:hypothetical protein [Saccharibacter floricola]GBQ08718.1 hypothetical protein AA15669_1877 [Saccharibacter floricola DSM 15669]
MTTASDVITSLEGLIEGALGSSENAATKTRIHAIASVIGSLGDEFAPLLERTFDLNALLSAIQQVENGITETEEGVHNLLHVLEKKNTATQPNTTPHNVA